MSARSYLFVPGDRTDMLAKAFDREADAVIADLEDSVAPTRKSEARRAVAAWLSALSRSGPEVWIRVNNAPQLLLDELLMLAPHRPAGIMVPKVQRPDELEAIAGRLAEIERRSGLESGSVRMLPIIETASGLLDARRIAAGPRVERLMIGEFDLAAELGIDSTDEAALLPLRMTVVVASAAAGIEAPLGPVAADFRDLDSLRSHTEQLRRRGFGARPAIHPAQVPVINEVFTPTADEIASARRLVERYDSALTDGRGSVTDEDGTMIDEAVVRNARRILDRASGRGRAS